MKEKEESLAEDIKTYSEGLILAIQTGKIQEGLEYVESMRSHLKKVQEYLQMKKSIPKE
ncbi:MAG: hypothetical protein PVG23_04510 [Nitrosopumilaceae archaeon]|jgi:hypothetical protein